jgi:alkanesulfonate monooxygenase SsuD/methylene tetrahydromethanopterin reductase-like flavin-dependent oxidoreductase (luciferase family)
VEIGIDRFVAAVPDLLTGANLSPEDRVSHLLEEMQLADEVGLDVFGIGEHHRAERDLFEMHVGKTADLYEQFLRDSRQALISLNKMTAG